VDKPIPTTSTTLLRDLADSRNTRWASFITRYEPMMRAFLRARFPGLDADDVIQETLVALVRVLPNYRYDPQEAGCFHNYLTGVLRNKALRILAARQRDERLVERVVAETAISSEAREDEEAHRIWRESVYGVALRQLLADDSVHERTKQVFIRLAINGEPPQLVAAALGASYAAVIKTKERMLERLRRIVRELKHV